MQPTPMLQPMHPAAVEQHSSPPGPWLVLIALRRANGMRQTDLAIASGISRSYLSDLENGRKLPGASMYKRLADALGTTPATIRRNRVF